MHFVEMGQRFAANTYSLNQIGIFKRLQVQRFNFMGFNYWPQHICLSPANLYLKAFNIKIQCIWYTHYEGANPALTAKPNSNLFQSQVKPFKFKVLTFFKYLGLEEKPIKLFLVAERSTLLIGIGDCRVRWNTIEMKSYLFHVVSHSSVLHSMITSWCRSKMLAAVLNCIIIYLLGPPT